MSKLTLELDGEDGVIVRRHFDATPESMYRAHTDPDIIQQWLLGPDGWSMPVCECDARPGGSIRYEWSDREGHGFSLTGEFLELDQPGRIVHIERMHLPETTPDNRVETTFTADGTGTLMVMRMQLPSRAARDAMMSSGMEQGMERSYERLEDMKAAGSRQ